MEQRVSKQTVTQCPFTQSKENTLYIYDIVRSSLSV